MLVTLLLPLALLYARLSLASCAHGTNLYRRASGGEKLPNFDYGPIKGPTNWHGISPDNILCGTGRAQSPINIDASIPVEHPGMVSMHVDIQQAELVNLGTTVEVAIKGTSVIGGREFDLQQFHFHTPGEHPIHGKQLPAEVHMVHTAKDNPNSITVVTIPIQLSSRRTVLALEHVIAHVPQVSKPGEKVELEALDISELTTFASSSPLFHYTGSLTTPPCTEGVVFLITVQPLHLRVEAYNTLRNVIGHNARFVQAAIPAKENVLVSGAAALGQCGQYPKDGTPQAMASPSPVPAESPVEPTPKPKPTQKVVVNPGEGGGNGGYSHI